MQPAVQVNSEILRILYKSCGGQELTLEEDHQLNDWLAASAWNQQAMAEIMDDNWLSANMAMWDQVSHDALWARVQQKIAAQTPVVPITGNKYRKWLYAAASIVIIGSATALLWWNNGRPPEETDTEPLTVNDVAPGINTARLTLADGSTILLDSAANGQLAEQGDAKVIKSAGGQLRYESGASGSPSGAVSLNTLTTPKGGQYQLSLPDGTRVWLNAASSITYPTTFTTQARLVTITGEAYFQVAKDARKPFKVTAAGTTVEVLGTHFNISAYDNEPAVTTTLEEGAVDVKLAATGQIQRLAPGQQALVPKAQSQIRLVKNADMEEAFAWIHGDIAFHDADLATIMRSLERWYNITVDIKGSLQERPFYFTVNRSAPLSEVLHFLEVYKINYSIDAKNRRLMITP
jgi:ferric-dicitrate binding protein FerR (iron transport regulator)